MKFLKIPFLLIWRLWFYILMFTTVILMTPFLLVFTFKEEYYHLLWRLVRIWSKVLIYGMGFRLNIQLDEEIEPNKSYMFCPNHASLMDPFVLIVLSKNPIVFVGKQELAKIPIFGFFYKRIVIMVDRSNPESRKKVYEIAKKRLQNGVSMAIFPEGLVPTEDVVLAPFKKGAFNLAIEFNIPIVAHVYFDCKRLFSWDVLKGGFGVFRVRQHQFISTKELSIDKMEYLKEKTFDVIYNDLATDKKYMNDTNRKR
ncbi:1-acyl-sn-glycerol-3-phosphate acyltransferase [Polaribacter sp. Hel1_33_78]|jgi:1-acyl-sn-glycerol-3-phosphate acyltransferase|uniref:lysophospholipid acyltransferase family protein n=1 Tax=Polaribacter sp. Hel1_33_78 TaxID=1336804 RepID=UPI00087AB725|nr:lysophospholipid acyltransferase family protein [Polaribacter sp. Hel1_33_78]MBT4413067.1 1-acyl-sn-glycerol-3-phosphate acyltransferase [Polaribacter sp.]MBT7815760.1 1-acyl-sn-glycerol-3-phosphate acyltransferase [Polaribacter sp.]SDU24867.1 1-acyl-sn-glycerol-3-phosphate acyltransferase [Polaribacter sp. Hel1_33_78]